MHVRNSPRKNVLFYQGYTGGKDKQSRCMCGQWTCRSGLWAPIIKITTNPNTQGACTVEFDRKCVIETLNQLENISQGKFVQDKRYNQLEYLPNGNHRSTCMYCTKKDSQPTLQVYSCKTKKKIGCIHVHCMKEGLGTPIESGKTFSLQHELSYFYTIDKSAIEEQYKKLIKAKQDPRAPLRFQNQIQTNIRKFDSLIEAAINWLNEPTHIKQLLEKLGFLYLLPHRGNQHTILKEEGEQWTLRQLIENSIVYDPINTVWGVLFCIPIDKGSEQKKVLIEYVSMGYDLSKVNQKLNEVQLQIKNLIRDWDLDISVVGYYGEIEHEWVCQFYELTEEERWDKLPGLLLDNNSFKRDLATRYVERKKLPGTIIQSS